MLFSIHKLAPKPKKIMQLLRLRQLHNGVFVRLNRATINMIRMVEPFVTYGYHVYDLVEHVFVHERMNDFQEMLIHHIAAVALYFSYIFGNILPYGSLVAYMHDLADIPINMAKVTNSTRYYTLSVVVFCVGVVVWFVTRLYSLPQVIYFLLVECKFEG